NARLPENGTQPVASAPNATRSRRKRRSSDAASDAALRLESHASTPPPIEYRRFGVSQSLIARAPRTCDCLTSAGDSLDPTRKVSCCQLASALHTPGIPPTRGAATPIATRGRCSHHRQDADHTSP